MTSEDMKTDRAFEKLGLPPMALAESSENGRNYTGFYKSLYSVTQKILVILLLTTFGICTYILMLKYPENIESNRNTEIIVVTGNNVSSEVTFQQRSLEIFLKMNNKTDSGKTRKKRQALLPPGTTLEMDDPFTNFSDDDLQKAREIIMKHDMLCTDENQQELCKDLVMQLKALNEKSKVDKSNVEKVIFKAINKDKPEAVETATPDLTKREALPIVKLDSIIESIPTDPLGIRDASPYVNPSFVPHPHSTAPHQLPDSCLLARLLKHNHPLHHEIYDPAFEHLANHYDHPSLPQNSYFSPVLHPYLENRDAEVHRRKIHPQDIDIFMSFLTPKPDIIEGENLLNSSKRDVDCPAQTLPCQNFDMCVKEKQWCDGNVDCPDMSDEARCSCRSRVDKARICDGYFDCPFGEDEMGCYGCSDNKFSCENLDVNGKSTCFSKEQRCNNVVDCPNHKDEIECNMLAPSLLKKPMFAISNTEGFLHRNFKGDWYAVCKNPYMWAHDACRRETGLIIRPPFIQIVPIDPMLKINYLNTGPGGLIQTSDTCLNSSAVYVTCPDLLCGTKVQSTSQFLRENVAIENQLIGRNKRFLLSNHPYPFMFYGNRFKRNTVDSSIKTDSDIKYGILRYPFDEIRNKRAESRVVGGTPSQPAAWPWMAAIYRNGMFHCGGVVLTHSWVVSAAHCVSKFWDHYYEVQVGMLRRFSFSPQEHSHKVTHIIVNQHYSQSDMKNDLCLLRVEPAIQFSRWVRPICLPGPDTAGPDWLWGPSPGTICTAVGWGAMKEHGQDPDHMREVEIPVWESCKHREDRAGKEICAGFVEGGRDACQGDSGGPLLCRNPLNSQQWYMAGIVSHGDGCGRKGEPGVYTRVSLFVKWIRYHISSKSLPTVQPIQDCPGFKCESGISKCLPNDRKCDMIIDCLYGEDETNCEYSRSANRDSFASNSFLSAKNNIAEDKLFATVTATSTIKSNSDNKSEDLKAMEVSSTTDDTTVSTNISTFTTDYILTTNKLESNTENIKTISHVGTHSSVIKDIKYPDFEHASTIEIANPESVENYDLSTEHVTTDPSTTYNDVGIRTRGDTESIMVEISGQSLESRSSVLVNMQQQEAHDNFDERIKTTNNPLGENLDSSTVISTNKPFSETVEMFETTTMKYLNENSENSLRMHDVDEITQKTLKDDKSRRNSEELIVELLPNSQASPDQFDQEPNNESENNSHKFDKITSVSNRSDNISTKILPDFNDKSEIIHKIEDIVFSELQQAKIRRKHRVPKEFECRRIFQVISYHHRCDHKSDCEDGTDELGCTCTDYLSTFDQNLICDGVFDCADGQDEIDCYSCPDDRFLCKRSQICLPIKHVCDGKIHCPQGEDEQDCFALSDGKEIIYDVDERPKIKLEGYLTKKHFNDWHVVCDDKLTIEQHEQSATHICRYLGFSSASRYLVKYINIKEDDIISKDISDPSRNKRDIINKVPVHFAYRQESHGIDNARHILIKEPQVIKEQCVPNITKTCKSLYVFCEHSLFTNFDDEQNLFMRDSETVSYHMWPWTAKVYVEGEYKCTGVLVNLSWVLVSESCLWDSMLIHHFITVALGSHRTIGSVSGMYEQVYQIDAKKHIYRNKVILLHLKQPSHYSNLVKPMIIYSSFVHLEDKSNCVAVGQDDKNNTVSVFLQETNENCHTSNRCFTRKATEKLCSANTLNRHWAGIVSCHTEQGWYPAASFVDSRGECGLGTSINGTEIENLKNEIKYYSGKKMLPSSAEQDIGESHCEGERCGRGRCVPRSQVCDGVRQCEDGKDESEQACDKKNKMCTVDPYQRGCECSTGQMKCHNGKCISKELFKDGNDDCGDMTDEPGQTKCSDYLTRVIPSRLCDGILHCHDRSDEDPMFCKCFAKMNYNCGKGSGEFYHCVSPDVVCDGVRDCPNGEDEQKCIGLHAPTGTPYGTGQVIVRSHGVWHSKCYPTQNHTKSELEGICRELGYIGGHAKEVKDMGMFFIHTHNNLVVEPFEEVALNNNTIIKMRNTNEPIAKPVFDSELKNCFPVVIECL